MKRQSSVDAAQLSSIWAETTAPTFRRLGKNVTTEVCVIGGGISGLTTAYLLTQAGKDVVLLEDGRLGSGMTQVTSAHLSNQIDDGIAQIERWHGVEGARLAVESHSAAIDRIETISKNFGIDCEFMRLDGYLFLAPGDDPAVLDHELEAAHRSGLMGAEMVPQAPIADFPTGPCLRFPNQARFHPLKYLSGLAEAIKAAGGHIYGNTHADHVDAGPPAKIDVGRLTVTADAVVVATNTPINDWVAIHTKQAPYMTYVIGARVPHGSVSDALYWDTLKAYHYVRLEPFVGSPRQKGTRRYDVLIVGGEDHKSGQADDAGERHARLEAWARERWPMIEEVPYKWGGQCMETTDGLAFIGRNPLDKDNVFIATGDSGMGLTHGTIAGMLLTDLILGRKNPWEKLYDPSRKNVWAAGPYLKENLNVAAQFTDYLTSGEIDSVDDIALGSGALLRRGLSKVAVYRDDKNKIHEMSAACPHLGCLVHWNPAETTWDCPCHGSRFSPEGKVLNGPANVDLSAAEEK